VLHTVRAKKSGVVSLAQLIHLTCGDHRRRGRSIRFRPPKEIGRKKRPEEASPSLSNGSRVQCCCVLVRFALSSIVRRGVKGAAEASQTVQER